MSGEEKLRVLTAVLKMVNLRVPIIAGVGSNDTKATIHNTKVLQTCGVNG